MQCSAVQFSAVQCSAAQPSTQRWSNIFYFRSPIPLTRDIIQSIATCTKNCFVKYIHLLSLQVINIPRATVRMQDISMRGVLLFSFTTLNKINQAVKILENRA